MCIIEVTVNVVTLTVWCIWEGTGGGMASVSPSPLTRLLQQSLKLASLTPVVIGYTSRKFSLSAELYLYIIIIIIIIIITYLSAIGS
jgi:hypothetical protein